MADEKIPIPSKEANLRPSDTEKEPAPAFEKDPISLEDGSAPPTQVLKHAYDADEAMKAFADGEIEVLDEATNKRLLRKIDLNIMPVGRIAIQSVQSCANNRGKAYVRRLRTQLPG